MLLFELIIALLLPLVSIQIPLVQLIVILVHDFVVEKFIHPRQNLLIPVDRVRSSH